MRIVLGLLIVFGLSAGASVADGWKNWCPWMKHANAKHGCDGCKKLRLWKKRPMHTHDRAGYAHEVGKRARPSRTKHYLGYYAGGGTAGFGEPRYVNEGTWGWDYKLHKLPWVRLRWTHGRRYQDGPGQYQTDLGPEPTNVFGLRLHPENGEGEGDH